MTSEISNPDSGIFICLGSNIDPVRNLPRALEALARRLDLTAVSTAYQGAPVGAPGTPVFLNAAAEIDTHLPPEVLKFEVLRSIEEEMGRVRTTDRNRPRTIDLDLVLYHQQVIEAPERGLVLPDPDILRYAHVVVPLAEVASDVTHPVTGVPIGEIARSVGRGAGLEAVEGLILPRSSRRGRPGSTD